MTERNLENILGDLDATKKMASINPDEPQYARTRAGIQTAVMQAQGKVEALKTEYGATVQKNGVAIFLYGPPDKTQEFAALVSGMGEAVVIDGAELYKRIADRIEPAIGRDRSINAEHVAMMHRALGEISKEISVWLSRVVSFSTQNVVKDGAATLEYVRNSIRNELGDELNSTYLKSVLAREALKIRYMGYVAPVIILNVTPEESVGLGLLFGKGRSNVEIAADDVINEDYIKKSFKGVQKNIKKNK